MSDTEIVEPGEIVRANNDLFRCKFKLKDIVAGRIFMAFASLVDHNSVKENESFVEYQIPASSILSDNCDGGDNYDQLLDAARTLVGHKIEQHNNKKDFIVYSLFSKIQYKNGIITGQFHKDLVPFFIIAKEKFTKMRLDEYMKLPSIYSQSMFGFLKSWSDKPEVIIKVADLHHMLGTPESFKRNFTDFKRWVLDKAYKDINNLTSIKYDYEAIKVGRTYKEIRFIFRKSLAIRCHKLSVGTAYDVPIQNENAVAFEKFFQKFPNPGGMDTRLAARKLWDTLHQSGNAPLASDVPDDNELSVIEFMEQWQGDK